VMAEVCLPSPASETNLYSSAELARELLGLLGCSPGTIPDWPWLASGARIQAISADELSANPGSCSNHKVAP
jgi:hypothetical protein